MTTKKTVTTKNNEDNDYSTTRLVRVNLSEDNGKDNEDNEQIQRQQSQKQQRQRQQGQRQCYHPAGEC